MKNTALFIAGLLISLSYCSSARAQGCATTLQPHFAVYHSASISGSTIYTTVSMQGYASVFQGPGCQMSTATHHVGAESKLNGVAHWTYSSNGCPTCYFTATDNDQLVGVPGVVYPFLWDGAAFCSIVGAFSNIGSGGNIPLVTAVVTQRNASTDSVSTDDAAGQNYQKVEGTLHLGPFIGSGTSKGCFIGFETIGTLTPSTYAGSVILRRQIVNDATYTNSTNTGGLTDKDDTSQPPGRDDDPQSGMSAGKVYDLDAPGTNNPNVDGNTYRYRGNFYAYATIPDGTPTGIRISPNYAFYVHISCTKTASGFQFVNDVPNDNKIGSCAVGCAGPVTWNLQ